MNNDFLSIPYGQRTLILANLREMYPIGCEVELVKMDDPYSKLKPGDRGVVTGVDDIGSIHVNWYSGSSLAVVYNEDEVRKV